MTKEDVGGKHKRNRKPDDRCRYTILLLGAVMVLAMHAGFAFLELVRSEVKIRLMRWSRSLPISVSRPLPISSSVTIWRMTKLSVVPAH